MHSLPMLGYGVCERVYLCVHVCVCMCVCVCVYTVVHRQLCHAVQAILKAVKEPATDELVECVRGVRVEGCV